MTSGNPEAPSDISLRDAAAYVAALVLLLALVFSANVSCLLFGLDGGAWVVGFSAQSARMPFSQVGVDPFQGSFDAYYPAFREYFLPEALALLFTGASAGKPLLYTVYGLQLTVSTYLLARAVGVSRSAGLLGGILLAVLALPTDLRGGSWVYGIYNMVPHLAQIVSLTSVIIASFWAMDGRRPVIGVALGMVAVASVMIATASFVTMTVLMAPTIAIYAGTCVFSVRERRTAALQIITAGACVAVPAALGMVQYVLVSGGYTAYSFFEAEFMQIRASLTFASVLYHDSSFGGALIGLSLLGAAHAVVYGPRRLRVFAATHFVATITFQIGAFLVVRFASGYRGPSPIYFEFMMWPIMLIFVGYLSGVVLGRFVEAARIVTRKGVSGRLANHALICIATIALGVWNLSAARHPSTCDAVGFSPMRANAITKELERTIAIGPEIAFRGLVATFTGASTPPIDWFACGIVIGALVPSARLRPPRRRTCSRSWRYRRRNFLWFMMRPSRRIRTYRRR